MTNQGTSLTRDVSPANGTKRPPTDWNSINWKKANGIVRRLRQRIFVATQKGEWAKVRSLQKLMLRSRSNILVSVRRVAQVNKGSKTPGVDKLTLKTPKARGVMVDQLAANTPWKVRPVRRVYIPKANGKVRPLGIPVIQDRALQAVVKNALEPSWEARFEGTSYGYRPGRGCHDAIEKIYSLVKPNTRKVWIVDADIKGAFDNISHEFILKSVGEVPGRELIRQWLKSGYVEDEVWNATEKGTPQGGVISPLLANIALHGLEEALTVRTTFGNGNVRTLQDGICYNSKGNGIGKRGVVRYADDFVVACESREDAEEVIRVLSGWLLERGLEFSQEKTRIVNITEGFDFLGFNIRRYQDPSTRTGWKLLTKPSKEKVNELRKRLRQEWMSLAGHPVRRVLKKLNPIIRGWANYYRSGTSKETFTDMDAWMFKRECFWSSRTHPKKTHKWAHARYWGRLKPDRKDHWVFGDKQTGAYLNKFAWTPIERHIQVTKGHSPDDPTLREYWERRKLDRSKDLPPSDRKIVERQKGVCPRCGESLFNGEDFDLFSHIGEELHRHHRTKRRDGGRGYGNLQYLHLFCHQQEHALEGKSEKPTSNKELVTQVRANLRRKLALPDDFKWTEDTE